MNRNLVVVLLSIAVAGVVMARRGGEGPFFPSEHTPVAVISKGAAIEVDRYLVDDGLTLLEFGADW